MAPVPPPGLEKAVVQSLSQKAVTIESATAAPAATWRRSERPRSSRAHGTRTRARGTCRRRRSTLASLRGTVEAAKVLR